MTPHRHGSAVIQFPNDLEIAVTRELDAPIQLVYGVSTKPEHVRKTIAPFGEEVTVCEIDLRVGGDYHFVFVTDDGIECSFRGTFLEIDPPNRTVETGIEASFGNAEDHLRSLLDPQGTVSKVVGFEPGLNHSAR